jgi:hypothetical protein
MNNVNKWNNGTISDIIITSCFWGGTESQQAATYKSRLLPSKEEALSLV